MSTKRILSIAAALLAVSSTSAFAAAGTYGLGYFRPQAPVGGRVWFSDKVGADLGLGFFSLTPDTGDSRSSFTLDAGLPIVAAESGNARFFIRPGVTYASSPSPVPADADNKTTQLWLSGSLGVEYYFTDRFSIQAAHGFVFKSIDPDQAGLKYSELASEDLGLSSIGFHFYFGGQ